MNDDVFINEQRQFFSDIDTIKKASETKKLVIFVGAGVSMNSGLPSWNRLMTNLKEDIGITDEDTDDSLQVAQVYYNQKNHKEYVEKIRMLLLHKKVIYNDLHEVLFDLKPEHVVTTNYDDCLEQVIKKRALPFSVIKQDSDFPYASNTNLLVKIHGDLDNDDFVLKEKDYLNYEYNHPLFEAFIKAVFSTKVILFIGYSYSDINLKIILQKVRNVLGKNYQTSYMLTHDELSDYKKDYLKEKGVKIISYSKNKFYIDSYLNGKNVKEKHFKFHSDKLQEVGQQLLDLIVFTQTFNRFEEELNLKEYIEQMYTSLLRYNELTSLPYYFISNLYPFNNFHKRVYHNEQGPFKLAVKNTKLLQFINETTVYKDGYTQLTEEFTKSLSTSNFNNLSYQLKYVVRVLNRSSITHLSNSSHDHVSEKAYDIIMHDSRSAICECFNCLFDNLNLNKLLYVLTTTNITETSDLKEDVMLAYAHYKVGNIYLSCNLFEQIGQKAWNVGKYITYFITKINYKNLSYLVDYSEYKNITEIEIEKLKERADKIDLEDIYRQINDILKEEGILIQEIRDDKMFLYCAGEIDEIYDNILKTHETLKLGTKYISAPNYLTPILFYLTVLNQFYIKNHIIKDEFSSYRDIINKALRAILIYYDFDKSYPHAIYKLDSLFCKTFVHYANAHNFEDFFKKFPIKTIDIDDEAKEDILMLAISYLDSYSDGKDVFGKIQTNVKVYNQSIKGVLRDNLIKYFDNILLLLSKVNLDQLAVEKICSSLVNYINSADFLYWKNIQYLSLFINGNRTTIPLSFYNQLLSIMIDKSMTVIMDNLEPIANALKNNNDDNRISNFVLISKIKNYSINEEVYYKKSFPIYLWLMSSDLIRSSIKKDIEEHLINSFDSEMYSMACFQNIIDYNICFNQYLNDINLNKRTKENSTSLKEIKDFTFINFIYLFYYLNISFDDNRLSVLTDLDDYMKFYLNPEDYNYSVFNPKWLEFTSSKYVHNRLRNYSIISEQLRDYLKNNPDDKSMSSLFIKYYL